MTLQEACLVLNPKLVVFSEPMYNILERANYFTFKLQRRIDTLCGNF